jgi:hypothetical protein
MSLIQTHEAQILASLDQLSPAGRREALRRLLPSATWLERAVRRNRPRIEAIARRRGLDWKTLTEEQRERLIDQLLYE